MTIWIKTGGSWRESTAPKFKVSSTWQTPKGVWVRTGGVWQKVFSGDAPIWELATTTVEDRVASYSARLLLQTNGDIYIPTMNLYGRWMPDGGNVNDYETKWDRTSGSSPTGSTWTENVWFPSNVQREVKLVSASSTLSAVVDIYIKHVPSGDEIKQTLTFIAGP